MTDEQFSRWKDFSGRMARTSYRGSRRPSAAWIELQVADFLDRIRERDIPDIHGWDHSIRGGSFRGGSLPICDQVTEFLDHLRPAARRCRACRIYEGECRCDEREERCYDQWDYQFGGPVRCCLRAGLDLVTHDNGMGVLGFTAGTLRRMYPEGVPDWIARQWDAGAMIGVSSIEAGIGFLTGYRGRCERFEDMADDVAVWL